MLFNCEKLEKEKASVTEKLEALEKGKMNDTGISRNSIGSDGDEYSSVQEMKLSLKHARQVLIQFI